MEFHEGLDVASTTVRSVHEILRFPITEVYVVTATSPNPVSVRRGRGRGRRAADGAVITSERTQSILACNTPHPVRSPSIAHFELVLRVSYKIIKLLQC